MKTNKVEDNPTELTINEAFYRSHDKVGDNLPEKTLGKNFYRSHGSIQSY